MLKKLSIITGTFLLALVAVQQANAQSNNVLMNAYLQLSNSRHSAQNVTHQIRFHYPGDNFGSMNIRYCQTASGNCGNTNGVYTDAAIDDNTSISGPAGYGTDGDKWQVTFKDSQYIRLSRDEALTDAEGLWTFNLSNIQNPEFSACNGVGETAGTCYVRITTYSDTNVTNQVASTVVSLTVTENISVSATVDPSFTMTIAGVNSGTVIGGITTTDGVTSTTTAIPFGNLTPGTPKYSAHEITISTNASNGYSVVARMVQNNMTGTAYGEQISPFVGGGANTNSPQLWSSPNGIVGGTNSGWLGVGTSDADAPGYVPNAFYPLNTIGQTVINSNSSANNDENYVFYAIEVNNFQRADSYTGTMRFNALPVY